jgi:uncharacterized protein YecT (DUF1311 family)
MKKIGLALTLISISLGANAAGCATPKNAFDEVYCAGNLFTQTDHDLNLAYGALKKHLNPANNNLLKQGQLTWIKARNLKCSKEDATGYFVNLSCAIDMTSDRLTFLKERERECKSTGCVDAKLGAN